MRQRENKTERERDRNDLFQLRERERHFLLSSAEMPPEMHCQILLRRELLGTQLAGEHFRLDGQGCQTI